MLKFEINQYLLKIKNKELLEREYLALKKY